MAIKLMILGLRRSGTTIFWRTFRQDERLHCYDEPFNHNLRTLPGGSGLKAPEEFRALFEGDPRDFWERFSPIHFSEEMRGGLSDTQRAWAQHLGQSAESVVFDLTRCQSKLAALHELAPDAVVVHLYRSPESQVSSHMLPSDRRRGGELRRMLDRRDFWTRTDRYDGWSFESVIGTSPQSMFGLRLGEIGLDADEVYAMPAVGKLLAYWRLNFEQIERDGRRLFGGKFHSQSFETFCNDPAGAIGRIYSLLGMPAYALSYDGIHAPNGPYQADSPRWEEYRERLGLTRPAGHP